MVSAFRTIAILACALAAGCASIDGASPQAGTPAEPLTAAPPVSTPGATNPLAGIAEPSRPEVQQDAADANPAAAAAKDVPIKVEPATRTAPKAATHATTGTAPKAAPPAKTPARVSAGPPVVVEPLKNTAASSVAKRPEQTLDVADLKARLRGTEAIGTFTKLALKNQMDDLLDKFRALHVGGQKSGVASLRQSYDALVVKVVSLLQTGDPSLAHTIALSREAIWGILSDPEKFKSVS